MQLGIRRFITEIAPTPPIVFMDESRDSLRPTLAVSPFPIYPLFQLIQRTHPLNNDDTADDDADTDDADTDNADTDNADTDDAHTAYAETE